jgi:stress-induced morphogen
LLAGEEIALEVTAEETMHMVRRRAENAGQNYNINIVNKTFQKVRQFRYLGTALTNQNYTP